MKIITLTLLSTLTLLGADLDSIPPISADEVVARMMEHDAQRQAALAGYTATRRYTLQNKSRKASMLVHTIMRSDGTKQFSIVEESGSSTVRKHVFHKILDEEAAASDPRLRSASRITPANYSFESAGMDTILGHAAYAIDVTPKTDSKYLIAGRIWVDAAEFALLRVDGRPAKSPSFWIKSAHFIHTYEKTGAFWFPASNQSVTDARIFGRTDMTIEYLDYSVEVRLLSSARTGELAQ